MSKASNLTRLKGAGFNVPPFVVIPAAVFASFRASLPGPASEHSFLEAPLPAQIESDIAALARSLESDYLAVRSSMGGEDSDRHSFAGQLESVLRVPNDREAVITAVRRCWASAYGLRVSSYRQRRALHDHTFEMEVILQAMLEPEASGIMFTADPVKRDKDWIVISVTPGLGDKLALGEETGETVRVRHRDGEVDGGVSVLSREQIVELRAAATAIEKLFGGPQDIEFCYQHRLLFLLQSRPISTQLQSERILWDNSNITESYSGVTSPMTFSIIRGAYARVYRDFLGMMGAVRVNDEVLRQLLGLYDGQVYYQMLNWYEALRSLPAFEQNRAFMEQMMGVKQPAAAELRSKRGGAPALATWAVRMIYLHTTSQRRADEFLERFGRIHLEWQSKNPGSMSPQELYTAYRYLEENVLGDWRAPILADFMAMIFYGALRRLSERWLAPQSAVHNDILAGEGGIESMAPARRVSELAEMVRRDDRLTTAFGEEPAEALRQIRERDELASFRLAFEDYLREYGDRCMNELKLEEPNLRDNPRPLIEWIAASARQPAETGRESRVRAGAEAQLKRLPLPKRAILGWLVNNTRRYVRNRENMRFARSRLYGMLRGILNSLGKQWFEQNILKNAHDIYFLTIDEVFDYVHGAAVTQDLAALSELRRGEYEAHRARGLLPNRFETLGIPYMDAPRDLLAVARIDEGTLQGTGCCSGTVRGEARVITATSGVRSLEGHILVAERTDPGWIFLFPTASGILVERGSPLSHSAIVAREMGKPIIVNIPGLTRLVQDGAALEMDGQRGTVRILDR
jgi:pyruvate,water dikinase